ncbi:unnamed protein product [Arctogadus glacialis]
MSPVRAGVAPVLQAALNLPTTTLFATSHRVKAREALTSERSTDVRSGAASKPGLSRPSGSRCKPPLLELTEGARRGGGSDARGTPRNQEKLQRERSAGLHRRVSRTRRGSPGGSLLLTLRGDVALQPGKRLGPVSGVCGYEAQRLRGYEATRLAAISRKKGLSNGIPRLLPPRWKRLLPDVGEEARGGAAERLPQICSGETV